MSVISFRDKPYLKRQNNIILQSCIEYLLLVVVQIIMDALQNTSEKYNMRINTKKTKVIRISQVKGRPIMIKVNGQNLEKVKQFCYLGSLVTEDGRSCRAVSYTHLTLPTIYSV